MYPTAGGNAAEHEAGERDVWGDQAYDAYGEWAGAAGAGERGGGGERSRGDGGTGKDAKTVWKPRTAEEMHRLEVLAQAAVGFDAKRGDQVVMQNVSFSTNTPEVKAGGLDRMLEQAKALLASQPGMLRTGVTGLIGLVLIWFVLKPVAGQVVVTLKEPALIATSQTTNQVAAIWLVPVLNMRRRGREGSLGWDAVG